MPLPIRVAVAVLACGLAGCAHTYVAADGSRHVVGLVWLTLPPTASDGEALRVRALGLSAVSTPAGDIPMPRVVEKPWPQARQAMQGTI